MQKLYKYKALNTGFIVLCSNTNFIKIKKTVDSIKIHYNKDALQVITDEKDQKQLSGRFVVASNNLNNMMNKGFQSSKEDWIFTFIANGRIQSGLDVKYSYFIDSDKDILFPVVNRKMNFIDADINGCFLRREAFLDIGNISEGPNGKLLWTFCALEKGYKFKGIVGAKLY